MINFVKVIVCFQCSMVCLLFQFCKYNCCVEYVVIDSLCESTTCLGYFLSSKLPLYGASAVGFIVIQSRPSLGASITGRRDDRL